MSGAHENDSAYTICSYTAPGPQRTRWSPIHYGRPGTVDYQHWEVYLASIFSKSRIRGQVPLPTLK